MSERFKVIAGAIVIIPYLAWWIFSALSSGRLLASRNGRDFAYRAKNPVSFWFNVGLAVMLLAVATVGLLIELFGSTP